MCDNETVMNKEDVVEGVVGNVGIETEPLFEEQVDENAPKDESNRFQQLTITKKQLKEFFPVYYTRSQMERQLPKLLQRA